MNKTHVRPTRDLRNNYAELAKIVKDQHDHVILTKRGHGDTVLIDFEDYSLYEQYLHKKYIDEKLAEAIEAAQNPDTEWIAGEDAIEAARQYLAQMEVVAKEA